MTAPFELVHEAAVREYLELNGAAVSKYSADQVGSNIRAASWFLERATGRTFRDATALTLTFTTHGETSIPLPGLRTATAVTLSTTALVANESYHLIPDAQQSGVYTAVQFRPFGQGGQGPWFLSYPDWWDRNLDSPYWNRGARPGSLPNDLTILGDWGYTDATLPEPVRHATKVLAAYYTIRPDALLSGARVTPDGGIFDLSNLPIEVQMFIDGWRLGRQAVGI